MHSKGRMRCATRDQCRRGAEDSETPPPRTALCQQRYLHIPADLVEKAALHAQTVLSLLGLLVKLKGAWQHINWMQNTANPQPTHSLTPNCGHLAIASPLVLGCKGKPSDAPLPQTSPASVSTRR